MKTSMNNRIAAAQRQAFLRGASWRGGFTLIELMAVIVIVSILAALTVSVGMYLRQDSSRKLTVATMDILSAAIAAYQDEIGFVPDDNAPNDPNPPPPTPVTENTQAEARSKNLYKQLSEVKSSAERLANLPQEAKDSNEFFLDGFERPIDYQKNKGMGGAPVLISAGPDGVFGFSTTQYPNLADREKYQKDNIQK